MRGLYALAFIAFGLIVWAATRIGFWEYQDLNPIVIQAIEILVAWGLAWAIATSLMPLWRRYNTGGPWPQVESPAIDDRPRNQTKFIIDVATALGTVGAVVVALFQPAWNRDQERLDNLNAYRNVACYSSRYIILALDFEQKNGQWPANAPPILAAVSEGLKAIDLKSVYPTQMSEAFVDINFCTHYIIYLVENARPQSATNNLLPDNERDNIREKIGKWNKILNTYIKRRGRKLDHLGCDD
ncbi:hypothetical protein SAMN05519103_05200 [Rhizobiales bacterium GAS113]|nr:hypothetical protein SAMN05519103_05200 [Rhizobiales bacterium GAS113]